MVPQSCGEAASRLWATACPSTWPGSPPFCAPGLRSPCAADLPAFGDYRLRGRTCRFIDGEPPDPFGLVLG